MAWCGAVGQRQCWCQWTAQKLTSFMVQSSSFGIAQLQGKEIRYKLECSNKKKTLLSTKNKSSVLAFCRMAISSEIKTSLIMSEQC